MSFIELETARPPTQTLGFSFLSVAVTTQTRERRHSFQSPRDHVSRHGTPLWGLAPRDSTVLAPASVDTSASSSLLTFSPVEFQLFNDRFLFGHTAANQICQVKYTEKKPDDNLASTYIIHTLSVLVSCNASNGAGQRCGIELKFLLFLLAFLLVLAR